MIRRAADRFHTVADGIDSRHSFSAGAHYDPDNIAFGALAGVDEHRIAPGAGFGWHAHRGVDIVSWVLSGQLRHEDGGGRVRLVGPGEVLVQRTGRGIRHCELNASAARPLHLVQMTLLGDAGEGGVSVQPPPVTVDGARFEVRTSAGTIDGARWHLFAGSGAWRLDDAELGPGDTVRGHGRVQVDGTGELLVWVLE